MHEIDMQKGSSDEPIDFPLLNKYSLGSSIID